MKKKKKKYYPSAPVYIISSKAEETLFCKVYVFVRLAFSK